MILETATSYDTGLYLRLSREDGDKLESDSIQNQRKLIENFIGKTKGFKIIKEYVDDGYSGTNFDRPRFQDMMEDIRKGRINCIVVKDLSRLGRNYIEMGRLIERILPSLHVRLVSVNDNYDSADSDSDDTQIIVPFKNLINDAYCRDISIKIRSNLDVKRRDGQFIGSFASYGYIKDPKNKNKLLIDDYAAGIIEMIFDMRINGSSAERITQKLNEMKVQPPYEYKRKCGLKFDSGFRSKDNAGWQVDSVLRVLDNEIYTGTMVQGKTRKVNYKIKQRNRLDETEWIKVQETHPAIISKEKFALVQELKALDTRVSPNEKTVYPLCGYVRCGTCGQNMVRRTSRKNGKQYFYYHCSTYKNGGDCTSHIISCEKIEQAVINALQSQIALFDRIGPLLKEVEKIPEERACIRNIRAQKEQLVGEISYYGDLLEKLYRDMVDGLLDKKEYSDLKNRFFESRTQVEAAFAEASDKEKRMLSGEIRFPIWIENLSKYRTITELSRSIVISTLDRVVVNDSKDIEIHFQFEDQIAELVSLIETENDKAGE